MKEAYQTVKDRVPKRSDHVWFRLKDRWKCVLCGAVTTTAPPAFPTPKEWEPNGGYEKLTDDEKALCPPNPSGGELL